MPASLRFLFLFLPLHLLISGCCSSDRQATVGNLMTQRLSWMDDVARFKQARGLPVTDPKREAALLQKMTKQGIESGLPQDAVRGFFTGQMAAARQYQKEWLASPQSKAPTTEPAPDLEKTIRPALDKLGGQLIAALSQARASQDQEALLNDTRQRLTKAGYSKAVIALAMDGLEEGLSR